MDFQAKQQCQGELRSKKQQMQSANTVNGVANEELLNRVRDRIKARGARGILSLGKSFAIMDDDRSSYLDIKEFTKALTSYRISSDPLEIKAIFETYDSDNNGEIDYDEFLRGMMGSMN